MQLCIIGSQEKGTKDKLCGQEVKVQGHIRQKIDLEAILNSLRWSRFFFS